MIAGAKQGAAGRVPDGEGVVPEQMLRTRRPPSPIRLPDEVGVGQLHQPRAGNAKRVAKLFPPVESAGRGHDVLAARRAAGVRPRRWALPDDLGSRARRSRKSTRRPRRTRAGPPAWRRSPRARCPSAPQPADQRHGPAPRARRSESLHVPVDDRTKNIVGPACGLQLRNSNFVGTCTRLQNRTGDGLSLGLSAPAHGPVR